MKVQVLSPLFPEGLELSHPDRPRRSMKYILLPSRLHDVSEFSSLRRRTFAHEFERKSMLRGFTLFAVCFFCVFLFLFVCDLSRMERFFFAFV